LFDLALLAALLELAQRLGNGGSGVGVAIDSHLGVGGVVRSFKELHDTVLSGNEG